MNRIALSLLIVPFLISCGRECDYTVMNGKVCVQGGVGEYARPDRIENIIRSSLEYWDGQEMQLDGLLIRFIPDQIFDCNGPAGGCYSTNTSIQYSAKITVSMWFDTCPEMSYILHEMGHHFVGRGHSDPRFSPEILWTRQIPDSEKMCSCFPYFSSVEPENCIR